MTLIEDPPAPVISHSAHRAHDLRLVTGAPFRCDGCMQPGHGHRYRCEPCNFDLHTRCALPTATVQHALFKGCTFTFHHEPPPAPPCGRRCDACGDDVAGYVYHCRERGRDLDLHPCCADLQESLVQDGQLFELRKEASHRCGLCRDKGERRKFWAYRCNYDPGEPVYLHVACLKRHICSGGQVVLSGAPIMDGLLQSLPRRSRGSRGFERFRKVVSVVVSVIIAVIFGNPMDLITTVAGPGGLLRG